MNRLDFFQVKEDGELVPVDTEKFDAKPDEVYVVVENDARIIFLWKGQKAGVRQKFIGSRATGDKRKEYGYHYKIEVMDAGDETQAFIEHVRGGEAVETSPVVESAGEAPDDPTMSESHFVSYAERAAEEGIEVSDEEVAEVSGEKSIGGAPSHIARMGGIGARPQRSFLSDPNFFADVKEDKKTREKVSGVLQETNKEEALELINALGSPKGFDREMLIVGQTVYRVASDDDETVALADLENPLDGVIMVQQYTPRILAENGKIKAVELLKQTSDEVDLDESLTQDLEDLTAMFQIEIE